jgi:RHS repeat-associated protein
VEVVEQIADANEATTGYYYDDAGFAYQGNAYHIRITDAGNKETYIALDAFGRRVETLYPSGDYEHKVYNGDGTLAAHAVWDDNDEKQWIEYYYDIYARIEDVNYPDGGYIHYAYDGFGRKTQVADYRNSADNIGGSGTIIYEYDSLDRITRITDQDDWITEYDYMSDGQKSQVKVLHPTDGTAKYHVVNLYDKALRLQYVSEPLLGLTQPWVAGYTYDDNGNRSTAEYYLDGTMGQDDNKVIMSYTYDGCECTGDNRLTAFATSVNTGATLTFSFEASDSGDIDGLKRLKSAEETITKVGGTTVTHALTCSYDERSQLTYARMTNVGALSWIEDYYAYNKDGNIYSHTRNTSGGNGTPASYSYTNNGDSDLLSGASGGETFSLDWDLNARMLSGVNNSLAYNWDGKLSSASCGNADISLKYHPDGHRLWRQSTVNQTAATRKYIVDTAGALSLILLEIDTSENDPNDQIAKTYVYAGTEVVAQHDGYYGSDIYFYLHDHLGSVRQIVDYSGSVVNHYTYDAWGNPCAAETAETITNPFRFAGYYWDGEISQYSCGARQYEPATYRFSARDPVCGLYDVPLTFHRYLYCANDPVGKTDPSGRFYFNPGDSMNDIMDKAESFVPSVVKDTLWLYNARNMDITTAIRSGDLWQMVEGLNEVQQNVSTLVQKWQLFRRASNAERCVVEARRDFVSELGKCGTEDFIISATGEIISTISEIITSAPGAGTGVGAATSAVGVLRTTACGIEAENNFGKRLRGCSGRQRSPD